MPTYDYQCRACGAMTEVIHSMLEEGPSTCERCGGELRRVLYPTGIIFKGSGFYATDSRAAASDSSKKPETATPKADGTSGSTDSPSKAEPGSKPAEAGAS